MLDRHRLKNGNESTSELLEFSSCQSVPADGAFIDAAAARASELGPAIFDSADAAKRTVLVTTVIRHPRPADVLTLELRQVYVIAEYGKFAPEPDCEWFLNLRLTADGANSTRLADSLARRLVVCASPSENLRQHSM